MTKNFQNKVKASKSFQNHPKAQKTVKTKFLKIENKNIFF